MNFNSIFILIISLSFLSSCQPSNEELMDEAYGLCKQEKYDQAIETYTKVIMRNSKLQLAYYNRGYTYLRIKKYFLALADFNKIIAQQKVGDLVITYNKNGPFANEEAKSQVPYNDVLYQKAQTEYYLDSLKNSFLDFQTLIENNYEEKSNCTLWQGTIFVRIGKTEKGCGYFDKARQLALTDEDRSQADVMITTYCQHKDDSR